MSLLTNALNQIRAWVETNYPLGIQHLPPGLNRFQIEALIQSLPFSLPDEIFELYQWSAGNNEDSLTNHAFFFDPYEGMALCSLERAIALSSTFDDEFDEVAVKYLDQPLFPIFEIEGSFLCLVGNLDTSPVIFVSDISEITIRYESLTTMMLTLAECATSGVISLGNQGYLVYGNDKFANIYHQHNPNLLTLSLVRLIQELTLIKSMPEKPNILKIMRLNDFLGQIYWLTKHGENLSLDPIHEELINSLITIIENEDDTVKRLLRQGLASLNDKVTM
jgi:hypothetical protein